MRNTGEQAEGAVSPEFLHWRDFILRGPHWEAGTPRGGWVRFKQSLLRYGREGTKDVLW